MSEQFSGITKVRPVRIGLAFNPTPDRILSAVEHATSVWGGIYYPFLTAGDIDNDRSLAAGLDVDVVHSLEPSGDSLRLAESSGYAWGGRGPFSPLAPTSEGEISRVISPHFLLKDFDTQDLFFPVWEEDDPLSLLFAVWFGRYGDPDLVDERLRITVEPARISLTPTQPVPAFDAQSSLIEITKLEIEYLGQTYGTQIHVLDPSNVADLVAFWNSRASGDLVFPWPVGHHDRLRDAAAVWLQRRRARNELIRGVRGDGVVLDPSVYIRVPNEDIEIPAELADLLSSESIEFHRRVGSYVSRSWRGAHPFETSFSMAFRVPAELEGRVVNVPVPPLPLPSLRDGFVPGVVAVDIEIQRPAEIEPGWTYAVPFRRDLASILARTQNLSSTWFNRPTHVGRAIGIHAQTETLEITAVPSMMVVQDLVNAEGWACSQTSEGVFAERLIERLGGLRSTVANQPGIRAALEAAANAEDGCRSGKLISRIRARQGSWPGPFASKQMVDDYAGTSLRHLLQINILRPVLPVTCPTCRTNTRRRPEELSVSMTCEMCLREFPLGLSLALSTSARNEWEYVLAGHVDVRRLNEVLPLMAALHILTAGWLGGGQGPSMIPHALGVKFTTPEGKCEVDIVSVHSDNGVPTVVLGEVKSRMDNIDETDLANLTRVQGHLRSKNIECVILVAVMRDLVPEEVSILRQYASEPPRSLPYRQQVQPVLPIVFTGRDLSLPYFDGDHPMRNVRGFEGMLALGEATCRRRLGLESVQPQVGSDGFSFRPAWRGDQTS